MAFDAEFDDLVRTSAFAHLRVVQLTTGGPVRREHVSQFQFDGERIALMDPQRGIRKPRQLDAALSIRTVHADRPAQRPYDDIPGPDGFLRYKWRGTVASHPENRAMRRALERRLPLIWFHGIDVGLYLPLFPVWLVDEEPDQHQFIVALDHMQLSSWESGLGSSELQREHALATTRVRLHQPMFRARVLAAYETRCSICHLKHQELLDAAHIRPDSEGGEPIVPNGLALCKIHHAAYDSNMVGINGDYTIKCAARPARGERRAHASALHPGNAWSEPPSPATTSGETGSRPSRREVRALPVRGSGIDRQAGILSPRLPASEQPCSSAERRRATQGGSLTHRPRRWPFDRS